MKGKIDDLTRLFVLWTFGILGGILFTILRMCGRIEATGFDIKKFIPPKEGLIIVYNHPSLWEPGVIVFLLFPWFLFFKSLIPYSAPDKVNFYDKWWFWSIKLFCIPIEREGDGRRRSLHRLIQKSREGKIIFLAPEGGRTHKGTEFKVLEKGKIVIKKEWIVDGKVTQIRRFQRGVSVLLQKTQATILPIWTEGGERIIPNKSYFPKGPYFLFPRLRGKMKIKIGKPLTPKNLEELEDVLLKLSQDGTSAP